MRPRHSGHPSSTDIPEVLPGGAQQQGEEESPDRLTAGDRDAIAILGVPLSPIAAPPEQREHKPPRRKKGHVTFTPLPATPLPNPLMPLTTTWPQGSPIKPVRPA